MITDPCVVRLLAEGGAIEIFGHREPDGSWSFVGRVANLVFDDDGNDNVTVGGIPRFTNLAEALPPNWVVLAPTLVHPDLRGWFHERYDAAVAALPEWRRETHERSRDSKWRAIFDSTPPDRWRVEEE